MVKTSMCECWQHKGHHTPTQLGGHTLHLEESYDNWRWKCSCGGCGKWQSQSHDVSYHGWLRHLSKSSAKARAK